MYIFSMHKILNAHLYTPLYRRKWITPPYLTDTDAAMPSGDLFGDYGVSLEKGK